jgi:hypothetical protein
MIHNPFVNLQEHTRTNALHALRGSGRLKTYGVPKRNLYFQGLLCTLIAYHRRIGATLWGNTKGAVHSTNYIWRCLFTISSAIRMAKQVQHVPDEWWLNRLHR